MLFRSKAPSEDVISQRTITTPPPKPTIRNSWFGWFSKAQTPTDKNDKSIGIARKRIEEMNDQEKQKLNGYYVRVRYNDEIMPIPGCALPGNHLEGDESFCTLVCPSPFVSPRLKLPY